MTGTASARWQSLRRRDPTVAILLAATIAHLTRRAPFDTFVFTATAALIVLDHHRRLLARSPLVTRAAAADPRWFDVAAVAYGITIGALPAGSLEVKAVMAVPGIVAAAAVLQARPLAPTRGVALAARRWRPWAALFVAAALWELASFLQQPSPTVESHDHPVLSAIVEPQLDHPWRRAVAAAVWLAVGCRLVRAIARAADVQDDLGALGRADACGGEAG